MPVFFLGYPRRRRLAGDGTAHADELGTLEMIGGICRRRSRAQMLPNLVEGDGEPTRIGELVRWRCLCVGAGVHGSSSSTRCDGAGWEGHGNAGTGQVEAVRQAGREAPDGSNSSGSLLLLIIVRGKGFHGNVGR